MINRLMQIADRQKSLPFRGPMIMAIVVTCFLCLAPIWPEVKRFFDLSHTDFSVGWIDCGLYTSG